MKGWEKFQMSVLAFGLLLGSATCGASQVTVSAPLPLAPFQPGDWIIVDIVGNFNTPIIATSFNVYYDPTLFQVTDVVIDPSFFELGLPQPTATIDNSLGNISAVNLINFIGTPVNTDFTFLTFIGQILAPGTFDLGFNGLEMIDETGTSLVQGIDYTVVPATISAVPVPAAVWLFGSGLLALVGFSRRRFVV